MQEEYTLQMENIEKEYFGNRVLKGVNISVKPGEIHALLGENGAGKSTLMNILFGMPVIHSTGGFGGKVSICGEKMNIKSPKEAMEKGIGMVHQEFMLIPGFTLTENIKLNREKLKGNIISRLFKKDSHKFLDYKEIIDFDDFSRAIEKVIGGIERKNFSIIEKEKRRVSFHEAGHALMGKILNTDLISKISIIPRSQALGYVMYTPDEERFLITKDELYNKIKVILGGRAAEEAIFGNISTGAKDDLKKANQIAFQMVCEYGMSDLQNRFYESNLIHKCYDLIDKEINKIIDTCYKDSVVKVKSNIDLLSKIADVLYHKETLTGEELNTLIKKFDGAHNLSII